MNINSQNIVPAEPETPLPLPHIEPETINFIGRSLSTVSVSDTGLGQPVHTFDRREHSGLLEKSISVNDLSVPTKTGDSHDECSAVNKLASSPFVSNPEDAPFTSGITLDMLAMPPELASLTIRTKPDDSLDNPASEPFRTFPRKPFDLAGTIPERFDQLAGWDEEKNDPTSIIAGGIGQKSYSTFCQFIFEDGDKMTPSDILRSSYYLALNRPTISASCGRIKEDKQEMSFWYPFGYIYQVPKENIFAASPHDAYVPMLSALDIDKFNMPDTQIFKSVYRSPNPLSGTELDAIFDEAAKDLGYQNYASAKDAGNYLAVYCKGKEKLNEELRKRKTFGPRDKGCCTREEIGDCSFLNEIAFYPDVVHEGKRSQAKLLAFFLVMVGFNICQTQKIRILGNGY